MVLRHNRDLIIILRPFRKQLDLPVKNGRALTEVDSSELDMDFSLDTEFSVLGIGKDVLL